MMPSNMQGCVSITELGGSSGILHPCPAFLSPALEAESPPGPLEHPVLAPALFRGLEGLWEVLLVVPRPDGQEIATI